MIVAFIAYLLDCFFGEPPDALHPVAWMGRVIAAGRTWALRGARLRQLVAGAVVAITVPVVSAAIAWAAMRVASRSALASGVVAVLLLKPMFAVRALRDAAYRVRDALRAGDIDGARRGITGLCSRKPDALDGELLVAATIESVAENTSDSVVAPLFYYALFGVPGAAFYRAVNTLDAMMGYHGRLEYAGKASARLDDLLNLIPARLTALLLFAAGAVTGGDIRRGVRIYRRDRGRTESPNAGHPMAMMAGLLGVRLVKQDHYALGDADSVLAPTHIDAAWRTASVASFASVALAGLARGFHG